MKFEFHLLFFSFSDWSNSEAKYSYHSRCKYLVIISIIDFIIFITTIQKQLYFCLLCNNEIFLLRHPLAQTPYVCKCSKNIFEHNKMFSNCFIRWHQWHALRLTDPSGQSERAQPTAAASSSTTATTLGNPLTPGHRKHGRTYADTPLITPDAD